MTNTLVPPTGQLSLTGPAEKLDADHWPVRGDLAHAALAGRCFVPHYAAPMPQRLACAAPLLRKPGGEMVATLEPGSIFDVLDIAGGWAWGQSEDGRNAGGLVGYLPIGILEPLS